MSAELLEKVNERYQMACIVHKELAFIFWHLSLPGFAALHEYQFHEETQTQWKLKRFITTHYHLTMPDETISSANLIEPLLKNRSRKDLKSSDAWDIMKKSWLAYQKWETETLKEYEAIAKELESTGEVASYLFMGEIVKEVNRELTNLNNNVIAFNAMDWDMSQIIDMQDTWYEKYTYHIRNLHNELPIYHHFNSA